MNIIIRLAKMIAFSFLIFLEFNISPEAEDALDDLDFVIARREVGGESESVCSNRNHGCVNSVVVFVRQTEGTTVTGGVES